MKFSFFGLIAILFFISCDNGVATQQSTSGQKTPVTVAAIENYTPPAGVDAKVGVSLAAVMNGYLELKNALAADNGKEAAKAGRAIATALKGVDTTNMTTGQKVTYSSVADDIRENAEHIANNADKIEHQRMHFTMLSDDIYSIAKVFGGGRKLYLTHCPMASDGKGASWLSEFTEIRNPYFGDQMLECGEVKEELK